MVWGEHGIPTSDVMHLRCPGLSWGSVQEACCPPRVRLGGADSGLLAWGRLLGVGVGSRDTEWRLGAREPGKGKHLRGRAHEVGRGAGPKGESFWNQGLKSGLRFGNLEVCGH